MVNFRWLGVAGVELEIDQQILLIDPFFTRPPLWKLLSRVDSDQAWISKEVRPAHAILVTHAHWDHLMDVAAIARLNGAPVYGSANTCQILSCQGLPASQVHRIRVGDSLEFGRFTTAVLTGYHGRTPLDLWINAPLKNGVKSPLRPIDYHKDDVFSYLISAGGLTLLHGFSGAQAAIFMLNPGHPMPELLSRIRKVRPQLIIPVHWDDFMRPLSRPLRPMLKPPSRRFPWISRINLDRFKKIVESELPGTKVLIPELFKAYPLQDAVRGVLSAIS